MFYSPITKICYHTYTCLQQYKIGQASLNSHRIVTDIEEQHVGTRIICIVRLYLCDSHLHWWIYQVGQTHAVEYTTLQLQCCDALGKNYVQWHAILYSEGFKKRNYVDGYCNYQIVPCLYHHFKFIVRLHESVVVLMVFSLGLVQNIALFKSVEYKAPDRKGPKNYLKMWD